MRDHRASDGPTAAAAGIEFLLIDDPNTLFGSDEATAAAFEHVQWRKTYSTRTNRVRFRDGAPSLPARARRTRAH